MLSRTITKFSTVSEKLFDPFSLETRLVLVSTVRAASAVIDLFFRRFLLEQVREFTVIDKISVGRLLFRSVSAVVMSHVVKDKLAVTVNVSLGMHSQLEFMYSVVEHSENPDPVHTSSDRPKITVVSDIESIFGGM